MIGTEKMLRITVALGGSLLLFSPALAQSPDISKGKKRAEVCMACHGEDGHSVAPGYPHLAGQDNEYLVKALEAYRGGQLRQDPTMTEMAKPLTDADIANITAFFSSLPR